MEEEYKDIRDFFLNEDDYQNLDGCNYNKCPQGANQDLDIVNSCCLQSLLSTASYSPLQVGIVGPAGGAGGSITNKKISLKGGEPFDNWTKSLLDAYEDYISSTIPMNEKDDMLWFYLHFLPMMEAPGITAMANLEQIIVDDLIKEYCKGFFKDLNKSCLNDEKSYEPPEIEALIQLDAGHDFLNIRPMADKKIKKELFGSQKPLSKYLLIHKRILVPFLRKVTKELGFLSRFFSSKPKESNILLETMKRTKFGNRETYFHSWKDKDFKNNPLLGFSAKPYLHIRTQTDIVPGNTPLPHQYMVPYLFPMADQQATEISPIAKLLDGTNKVSHYNPVYNPKKVKGSSVDNPVNYGISKYNESIGEVKNAYSCLKKIELKLIQIVNAGAAGAAGAAGDSFIFELNVNGIGIPPTHFTIEKTGEGKSFLGGQPFCHLLICLIISADYTANKIYNIKTATTITTTLDIEKNTERTKLKNYLINMADTNSLSNQFKHLENIINLWEKLQITSQQFIAIILMTKQLGDYGQASTWCIDNDDYVVDPDPKDTTTTHFIHSTNQAIVHITGDRLCMASFAKKISESSSKISEHVGAYWGNGEGCFIIYPKHYGFTGPTVPGLLSRLKIPKKVKGLPGGAQRDSPKKKNNKQVNLRGGSGEIKKYEKYKNFIEKTIHMIEGKFTDIINFLFTIPQDTEPQDTEPQNFYTTLIVLTEADINGLIDIIKNIIAKETKQDSDYYYTAGFDEEIIEILIQHSKIKKWSNWFRQLRKLLYKIEACKDNITTTECITNDERERIEIERRKRLRRRMRGGGGRRRRGGGKRRMRQGEEEEMEEMEEMEEEIEERDRETEIDKINKTNEMFVSRTQHMKTVLEEMSSLYYELQDIILLHFNDIEPLNQELNYIKTKMETEPEPKMDTETATKMETEPEPKMDTVTKMETEEREIETIDNKKFEKESERQNKIINFVSSLKQLLMKVNTFRSGGGQKKKNKDIEIKKCCKEKKVGAKEKEKLKIKKEKEKKKIKKEKEKEKTKMEKLKEKEKIKKEKLKKEKEKEKEKTKKEKQKEKEKIKKEKLKEKLKKEKEKEKLKIKKEKQKEKEKIKKQKEKGKIKKEKEKEKEKQNNKKK